MWSIEGAVGEGLAASTWSPAWTIGRWLMQVGLVGALVLGEVVALGAVGVGVDDHVGGVDLGDDAGVGGADELAGVERGALLHARAHVLGARADQGHGLALHVRAHEGTLGVVVLEERDEVGRDGEQLARRDVHVVDLVDGDLRRGRRRSRRSRGCAR